MDIDNARCPGLQAPLHKLVVLRKVSRIQWVSRVVVDQPLPSDGETENIEFVIIVKMFHLTDAIDSALQVWKLTVKRCLGVWGINMWLTIEASGGIIREVSQVPSGTH